MNSFSQKSLLKTYKRRIQRRIEEVVEDAENACATIQGLTCTLKERADALLKQEDEKFCSEYQQIYKDIEALSEKLFLCIEGLAEKEVDEPCFNIQKDAVSSKTSSRSINNDDVPVESSFSDSGMFSKCQSNTTEELTESSREYTSPDSSQSLNTNAITIPKSVCENSIEEAKPSSSPFSESNPRTSPLILPHESKPEKLQVDNLCCKKSNENIHYKSYSILSPASSLSVVSCEQSVTSMPVVNINPRYIPDQIIPAGTVITALITKFISPSDFWIQLENTIVEDYLLSNKLCPLDVPWLSKIKYCATYNKRDGYRRAEILSVINKDCDIQAEVLFLDYGGTSIVPASDLMVLPDALYMYPAQAIQCFLHGVIPFENEWSQEVLEEFDKVSGSELRAVILYHEYKKHAVQLLMTVNMPDSVETWDFAQMLCLQQLAKMSLSKSSNANLREDEGNNDEEKVVSTSLEVPSPELYAASDDQERKSVDTTLVAEPLLKPDYFSPNPTLTRLNSDSLSLDGDEEELYLSDETDDVMLMQYAFPQPGDENLISELDVSTTVICDNDFDMDLIVPSAQPLMLQDDLLVIVPSVVYSPTYFYANNSTGNPLELDELREDMTTFYSSLTYSVCLTMEDLKEDMYLACPYEDGYWYRVQINLLCDSKDELKTPSAVVFYVDYGNETMIPVSDLRPLTRQFAKYPAMAILCALAYVVPPKMTDDPDEKNPILPHKYRWNTESSERFRKITESERPLTAQISRYTDLKENRTLHEIFLWDIDEQGEKIINDILVEEGFAEYRNLGQIPSLLKWKESVQTDPVVSVEEQLRNWDPMSEDFESVENSYGVDTTDPGVATVGYKANDESYICKYYADGICHRGENCPYQHILPGYAGQTVDQEAVYLHENTFPLPEPGKKCLLQVSCFMNTGHFYVIFPYGPRSPQEIQKNSSIWINYRNEFQQLSIAMRDHYEGSPLIENTKIALAYGTIVAAKTKADGMWYRARVIEVEDVFDPVQVFFVDFGMTEWVNRHNVREIKPEFLHCPFQAIEAFLANVDPIDRQIGKKWSLKSKSVFQNMVSGKILLGYVNHQIGSVLFLTLQLTTKGSTKTINDLLVEEGLAEVCKSSMFNAPVNVDSNANGNRRNIVPG